MKGNPRLASKLADGVFPFIVLNSYLLCKKITHPQSVLQPTVIVFTKGSKNGTTTKRQTPPHILYPIFSYAKVTSLTNIVLFSPFLSAAADIFFYSITPTKNKVNTFFQHSFISKLYK